MRVARMVATIGCVVLLAAGCGGSDDINTGGTTTTTTAGGSSDDGGGDGGGSGGDFAAAIAGLGGCSGAAAAVSAAIVSGFNPQAAEGIAESREQLEELASNVPEDIQADVELLNQYMQAYSDALGDFGPEDYADPAAAQQIGEAFEALEGEFPQDAMSDAGDNINRWFTEECPALAGE